MKILITGGGGFVGRNLARCLRTMGHEVLAPTRQELDMTNLAKCTVYFEENKIDAIVHAAFTGHYSSVNPKHQDFIDNMRMYEMLTWFEAYRPVFIIGSGAEFDRRFSINFADENELLKSWPVDLYGLSKNIIAKRALGIGTVPEDDDEVELHNPYVLRLFGCFGADEPDFRFIKRSITRLKQGLPIEIEKNCEMDFFFVDDVAIVIDHILKRTLDEDLSNLNLVYEESTFSKKHTLADIGVMICKAMHVVPNIYVKHEPSVLNTPPAYTGNGFKLRRQKLPLIGLQEGINRMVKELA